MDGNAAWLLLGGAAILIALASAVALLISRARKRRTVTSEHDDLQRVGRTVEGDGGSAANSAIGLDSWMRPGGGF